MRSSNLTILIPCLLFPALGCHTAPLSVRSAPPAAMGLTPRAALPAIPPAPAAADDGPEEWLTLNIAQRDSKDLNFNDIVPGLDLSEQTSFGFESSSINSSGLGFETALIYSSGSADASGITVDSSVLEVGFGGRYTYTDFGALRPYVGGGIELLTIFGDAAAGGTEITASDVDFGGDLHGGAYYMLTKGVALGIDLRSLFGTEEQDYTQFGLTLGFSW